MKDPEEEGTKSDDNKSPAQEPGTEIDLVASPSHPDFLRTFAEHVIDVLRMASPIIISEIFQNTLPVVDIAFVGNLPDKDALGAAALATVWFNLWNATMLGFTTAIDTLLAQAYGAKELRGFGLWTGASLVIVMIATVFVSGLLALCGPMMKLFGQDDVLAERAQGFSYRLIPGLFPYYAFKVLVKYLQAQNITLPGAWIGLGANLVNILLNWLLIFRLEMGLNGAPWATTITRFAECIAVFGYIYWNRETPRFKSTWPAFSREFMCSVHTVKLFLKLAFSGALSISAEAWSFEIATILAGLLGTVELNAHIITLSIATFLFLSFPFAIGIAASIRVGQWIGDGSPENAQRSANVSYLLSGSIQLLLIVIVLLCNDLLAELFSSDDDVGQLVRELLPLSCIFMMGDAILATNGGILRGLGRQKLGFLLNILGFWILAIPVGSLLTFVGDAGVAGLWWGYVVGIYVAGTIGLLAVKYHISWTEEAKKAAERLSTVSYMLTEQTLTRHSDPMVGRSTDAIEEKMKNDTVDCHGEDLASTEKLPQITDAPAVEP
jgi:multidrug resistance protein, MATE family